MTNEERNRKGLTSNPFCKAYPGEVEDLNHIFRYYMKSIPIWKGIAEDKCCFLTNLESHIGEMWDFLPLSLL